MESEEKDARNEEKKCRERKKHILSAIKRQMEFYFGDANLRHDRFLRKAILEDKEGYVKIDVIANFNKMKQISDDISLITKAIQRSELLEISMDKLRVRRKLPLPEPENTDARTIYIERLPAYADQDWLREMFSCCGTVEYISLPRYKTTKEIKGFAFIEYAKVEEAAKACQILNSISPRINKHLEDENDSHTKVSPKKSVENQESMSSVTKKGRQKRKRHKSESFSDSDTDCKCLQRHSRGLPCTHKRRRFNSESLDSINNIANFSSNLKAEHDIEKETLQKTENLQENTEQRDNNTEQKSNAEVCLSSSIEKESCGNEHVIENKDDDESSKKKHKRKRKRNRKAKEEKQLEIPHLYVIPKKEWVRLKKLYKNLQRNETKMLKVKMNEKGHTNSGEATLNIHTENCKKNTEVSIKPLSIPVVSGTILQIKTIHDNEILTKKTIKKELDGVSAIAYIDVKDGDSQGYIRMKDIEAANALMKSFNDQSQTRFSFSIRSLDGLEEESYYMKINEDRKKKFSEKPKKERGSEKVKINRKIQAAVDKALNGMDREHIRFEDQQ